LEWSNDPAAIADKFTFCQPVLAICILEDWPKKQRDDGTDDGTLLAACGYATRYMQSGGIGDGSGTDDGDVALLGLRKFLINDRSW